jgi:hypothetical protein
LEIVVAHGDEHELDWKRYSHVGYDEYKRKLAKEAP